MKEKKFNNFRGESKWKFPFFLYLIGKNLAKLKSLNSHLNDISNNKYMFCYNFGVLLFHFFFCIPSTLQQQCSWTRKVGVWEKGEQLLPQTPVKRKTYTTFITKPIVSFSNAALLISFHPSQQATCLPFILLLATER